VGNVGQCAATIEQRPHTETVREANELAYAVSGTPRGKLPERMRNAVGRVTPCAPGCKNSGTARTE